MARERPSTALGQYAPVSYIPRPRSSSGAGNSSLRMSGGPSSSTPAAHATLSSSTGLPTPAARTLKRTSVQAGLSAPTPLTARKRTLSGIVPSTPASGASSAALASLKADLEASASLSALQRQLGSSQRENGQLLRELGAIQERVKTLERERAILLAQQEKHTSRDEQRDLQDAAERRELVTSLGQFREKCALLEEQTDLLKSQQSSSDHERDIAVQERENTLREMEVLQEELAKVDEENAQLKADRQASKEAQETIQELREQLAQRQLSASAEPKSASNGQENVNVSEVLRKELHHQVQHLRTLEHSNSRLTREVSALKGERANVELLKEEKLSLETKVRRLEGLRKKLAEVELECGSLRREKEEWAAYLASASSGPGDGDMQESFSSPAQMAKTLASARIELLSLREKLGGSSASLKSRDELITELEGRVAELQDVAIPHWQAETQKLQDRLKAAERTASLDQKELGMLREQISTYAVEEASMLGNDGSANASAGTGPGAYDSQKSLQIKHLEELLEAHKAETARNAKEAERLRGLLEARGDDTQSIDASTPTLSTAKEEEQKRRTSLIVPGTPSRHGEALSGKLSEQIKQNEELQEALRAAREELAEMSAEMDALDAQIDNLNFALGRGEYNVSNTKVVSFSDNPAALDLAVRTETLENLREENRVLLERVSELEQRAPAAALPAADGKISDAEESVPKQTYLNLQAEKDDLLLKIEQAEKSRLRLKEIFARTAQELRDAVRSLFGYRLEPLENSRIKITTVFGGSEYNLIFGPAPAEAASAGQGQKLALVGGNEAFVTSQRVQQGLEFWVAQRGCLPGFLSTITLELFEESTRGRTAGWTESN